MDYSSNCFTLYREIGRSTSARVRKTEIIAGDIRKSENTNTF